MGITISHIPVAGSVPVMAGDIGVMNRTELAPAVVVPKVTSLMAEASPMGKVKPEPATSLIKVPELFVSIQPVVRGIIAVVPLYVKSFAPKTNLPLVRVSWSETVMGELACNVTVWSAVSVAVLLMIKLSKVVAPSMVCGVVPLKVTVRLFASKPAPMLLLKFPVKTISPCKVQVPPPKIARL